VAVHRTRLFARHLPALGWEPHILTVHEQHYEETLDWDLCRLLPEGQKIYKSKAFNVTKPRLIGDIGLRGFFYLLQYAVRIIKEQSIDLIYIPIPSFYGSLLGRLLQKRTGVPYGIDFIDPWVQIFPGSEKIFSRHWWSTQFSRWLEPMAVRKASFITGVAEGYYRGVQNRNPELLKSCLFAAMPYGGEAADHDAIKTIEKRPYLFTSAGKYIFVYAGALLPKAHAPLEAIFRSIAASKDKFINVEFHFIGTGTTADDPEGYKVRSYAQKYGLWGTVVFEHPKRISYLDVLVHLAAADAIFILGSTEPHYTPSKTYQSVLSKKPIFAVLHNESTSVEIIRNSHAGQVLDFGGEEDVAQLEQSFLPSYQTFRDFADGFDPTIVDHKAFHGFSAFEVTSRLVTILNKVVEVLPAASSKLQVPEPAQKDGQETFPSHYPSYVPIEPGRVSAEPSRNPKVLIIYPHYPPSNLVGVHRIRLFAQHLPSYGWRPCILTVHERHYEERLDYDMNRLLPEGQWIVKTSAFPLSRPRLIGDIGLRAFLFLYFRAVDIIRKEKIDLVYFSIPSYYVVLLGPMLKFRTGILYGVDYQDPWVHEFPGSQKTFSRHWWSSRLSRLLEPLAIRKATWITGVAESYYQGVKDRNPRLSKTCLFDAMPMGGEVADHRVMPSLGRDPYVFQGDGRFRFVYAGALLPKAYEILDAVFRAMSTSLSDFKDVEFHFIGTGRSNTDPEGFKVRPYAERYGLWGTVVFEFPQRIPYLDVLVHLEAANAVFILGSTEAHYTPSKTYQGVLSGKPVLAVLHQSSTAIEVLRQTGAGMALEFAGESDIEKIDRHFMDTYRAFRSFAATYHPSQVNTEVLDTYSAHAVTGRLARLLNVVMGNRRLISRPLVQEV